jgi:hypothetical protein
MKFRSTLILVLLTGALLAFIFIQEHHQPTTQDKIALQSHPFQFKPADADEFEVERKDDSLHLQLRDGSWRIGHPFDDTADPDQVKKVLEAIPSMEWVESIERKDLRKDDLKRTGLGDDVVTITIRGKGQLLAQASFGGPAPLEDCVYASVPPHKDVIHVAKTTLPTLLAKPDEEWRDPKLVRLKPEDIRHFSMNAGTGGMEFARGGPDQPWRILKPIQTRASDKRLNALIRGFLNLDVKPAKSAVREPTSGSELPDLIVTLEAAGLSTPVVLTLHSNVDPSREVQVQTDNREGVFLASPNLVTLWKLQPNDLRDQNLAHIPKEQTTALRIRSLINAEVVLDKKGDTWMLTRFGKTEPANQERVARLIDTLNAAQVREFLSDAGGNLEPWGLQRPFLSVEWQAAGKTSVLEFGQGPGGILTARHGDEPFIYRASAVDPNSSEAGNNLFSALLPDSLRWRGTKVINVSMFSVRRIIVAEGDRPATTLLYNPDDATWTGSIAGRDVTAQLDRSRANKLLQRLVDFQISDWNSDRAGALSALQNPSLTVQLLIGNPGNPATEPRPVTLTFAPLQPGMDTALYNGRKDQDPDTFFISRDIYHELTAPVVK